MADNTKKVLILGAGMVAKPMVNYLLSKDYFVTLADLEIVKAKELIRENPNGRAISFSVENSELLEELVSDHDITVSLLPFVFHVKVAKACLKYSKSMVTTSYVKPEMKELDEEAKSKNVLILNEIGVDPGIDHMSAMRIIDHIHDNGGEVEEFYSFCGALVAPEVEKNPFAYKFTWAPKGVVMACNNDGKYLKNGDEIYVPTEDLFKNPLDVNCPQIGDLKVYPNRDSLPYIKLYGIEETKTILRGTFRYPNWCEIIDNFKQLGLLDNERIKTKGISLSQFLRSKLNINGEIDSIDYIKNELNGKPTKLTIEALEFLGFFSERKIEEAECSPFDITSDLMIEKMMVGCEERDMIVMQHLFKANYKDGSEEVIRARMVDYGTLVTDTSVARTVALPAAVAVDMILQNRIDARGVHIPVIPEIYNPVLDTLETLGIKMNEEYGLPNCEMI